MLFFYILFSREELKRNDRMFQLQVIINVLQFHFKSFSFEQNSSVCCASSSSQVIFGVLNMLRERLSPVKMCERNTLHFSSCVNCIIMMPHFDLGYCSLTLIKKKKEEESKMFCFCQVQSLGNYVNTCKETTYLPSKDS